MRKRVRFLLALVLAVAVLAIVGRQVIYEQVQHGGFDPQPPGHTRPSDVGLPYESVAIRSGDHTLDAWWIPSAGPDSGAVLIFHGNAEEVSEWLTVARLLHRRGLDVMLFDYAGYGRSTGKPSVDVAIADGLSALQAFDAHVPHGVRRTGVGLSLGTGVLMEAVARAPHALDAVVLLEPFSSGKDAAIRLKLLPAWLAPLMPDAFDNVRLARGLHVPLLVVHSTDDERFPVEFGAAVAHAAPGPGKLIVLNGYRHASAYQQPTGEYWAPVVAWAQGLDRP